MENWGLNEVGHAEATLIKTGRNDGNLASTRSSQSFQLKHKRWFHVDSKQN